MFSCLSPFLSATVILVLFGVGAFAETFPRSVVHSSSERTYIYCSAGGLGWLPFENGRSVCREWPLVVSPGSPTLLILCYEGVAIGLTRSPGNSSSIDSFGLNPRTGNVTITMINPPPTENYTFESRCENPAPAETTAQKNSWRLPNNLNPKGAPESGPCCALEFNVPTTYIGDLYYQSITGDLFYGPMIIEANVTSITTTTTPPTNNTTPDSGTTTTSTTTTSTTTTTPPVPTSTPLPPNNTTTGVPTSTPTPTTTMSPTPTPTMVTNTTSPPTTINPPNDGANSASASLASYSCTLLTMLVVVRPSYFSVL